MIDTFIIIHNVRHRESFQARRLSLEQNVRSTESFKPVNNITNLHFITEVSLYFRNLAFLPLYLRNLAFLQVLKLYTHFPLQQNNQRNEHKYSNND